MNNLFTILAVFVIALPSLHARTVRAIFLQPPANSPEKAFLFTGKKSLEIPLPRRNLSPEIDLPDGDLELAVLPHSLAEGEEIPKGTQTVKIPKEWKRCVMVFIPRAKRKSFPARVMVINASTEKFPKGNTIVYNLTDTLFLGKFGTQTVIVKPRKSGRVKPPIPGKGAYPVAIDYISPETQKRRAICRTNWMHHPDARQILFVTSSPEQPVPRVWGVLDRRDEKKEE